MVAKLHGFIRPPASTFRKYPETDTSLSARLARAIAYREVPDYGKALELTRALITDYPNDPYLHELEGQLYFEDGQIDAAVAPLTRANELAPEAGLIEVLLARVLLAQNLEESDRRALDQRPADRSRLGVFLAPAGHRSRPDRHDRRRRALDRRGERAARRMGDRRDPGPARAQSAARRHAGHAAGPRHRGVGQARTRCGRERQTTPVTGASSWGAEPRAPNRGTGPGHRG
jgi:tetratricopeptide (TPR) repeat protein